MPACSELNYNGISGSYSQTTLYKNVILYILGTDEKWGRKMIIISNEDINIVQW